MSEYTDYEHGLFDNTGYNGTHHYCRCGEVMVLVPDDDPKSDRYEWLCPYCDEDQIKEQS